MGTAFQVGRSITFASHGMQEKTLPGAAVAMFYANDPVCIPAPTVHAYSLADYGAHFQVTLCNLRAYSSGTSFAGVSTPRYLDEW